MSEAALSPTVSASVSASAGTGKTWLLTSRIVRLLLAGADPGGILALTFTRKAAAEMRLRVNDALRELAESDAPARERKLREIGLTPDAALSARARQLYRQQLFQPFGLRASTLHAFCRELVSRFAFEAGVTPGFKLVEEELALRSRAWRRVQTQILWHGESAPAQALSTLMALGATEHQVRGLVMDFLQRRNDWRAFTWNQPEPLAFACERLRAQLAETQTRTPEDPKAFNAKLCILLRHLQTMGGTRWLKPEKLALALEFSGEAQRLALAGALLTQNGVAYKVENDKALGKLKGEERHHFLCIYEEVVYEFDHIQRAALSAQTLARNRAAYALGVAALKAFELELARDGALGFAEVEWHALQLLRQDGAADWVRYKLDQRIEHLLVDEFQDTSSTQWQLLRPLLEEMTGGDDARARSAFIVGDAKQSIFGFRRANPEVFEEARQWIAQLPNAIQAQQTESRRSAPAIVNFLNSLFDGAPGAAIGFAPHSTARRSDWGQVEVMPPVERGALPEPPDGMRDPLVTARVQREDFRPRDEARAVAARIVQLLASGVAVSDRQNGHRISYNDLLVLARKRTHLPALERALGEAGIPFVGAARGTLLHTAEARDLLALLRFLDAPHRDLELAQVLRSPLFSLEDEALIRLARASKDSSSTWFDAMAAQSAGDPPLQRPLQLLSGWRALAAQLPVHDLLDHILNQSNAANRYRAALLPGAAARIHANLGALLQLALETDHGRYPSLSGFLAGIEERLRDEDEAPDEAAPDAPEDSAGQVRILTVHAAKGLEAAAVFIVNAGFIEQRRTPHWLVEWPAGATAPTHFVATGGTLESLDELSKTLAGRQHQRETRENLNLLYVAVTRARQFLHISGSVPARGSADSTWHTQALRGIEALSNGAHRYEDGQPATQPAAALPPRDASDPRLRQPLVLPARNDAPPSGAARPAGDPASAARGSGIHFLLQTLSENPGADETAVRAGLARVLQREPTAAEISAWRDEARAVLNTPALAKFFGNKNAWNEVSLSTTDAEAGIADRIVDDGETIWVLDYKTGLPTEQYRQQMAAYMRAACAIWPTREVRGGLILTATCEWVENPSPYPLPQGEGKKFVSSPPAGEGGRA